MSEQDATIAMRPGEAIDAEALDAELKSHLPGLHGTPVITQFPGGASNLTYRLVYPETTLILRRPPFGPLPQGAHNMLREARWIQAIKPHYALAPEVQLIVEDSKALGCDYYIMTEFKGLILRRKPPATPELTSDLCQQLSKTFVQGLVDLHAINTAQSGLNQLGKGKGYIERQVNSWRERLSKAQTPDVPEFTPIGQWLAEQQPQDRGNCLIHNDYRFDNLVLDPQSLEIRGVLDWELATLGDPLMDLGTALAYWVEANDHPAMLAIRPQPTHLPGMYKRHEIVQAYFEKSGQTPLNFQFYEVFGLFRLAGILQQIYARYQQGQTQDPRFAGFGQVVSHLHQRCQQAITA